MIKSNSLLPQPSCRAYGFLVPFHHARPISRVKLSRNLTVYVHQYKLLRLPLSRIVVRQHASNPSRIVQLCSLPHPKPYPIKVLLCRPPLPPASFIAPLAAHTIPYLFSRPSTLYPLTQNTNLRTIVLKHPPKSSPSTLTCTPSPQPQRPSREHKLPDPPC